MADAAVVAAHWQQRHGDPGYPSLRAAVAGAGSPGVAAIVALARELAPGVPARS